MPTFASTQVSVTPQTLLTSATLDEINRALIAAKPGPNQQPGWGSPDDSDSMLGIPSSTPPASSPTILPADGDFPERIFARFYFWRADNRAFPVVASIVPAPIVLDDVLDAVDVFISGSPGNYLVLWSTSDGKLASVDPRNPGRAYRALLAAAKALDNKTTLIANSILTAASTDVFLWLTNQMDLKIPVSGTIHVHGVEGISADEGVLKTRRRGSRSGLLRGEVDFQRTSFMSAIAERLPLGPATITLNETVAKGRIQRIGVKLHADGMFSLAIGKSTFREVLSHYEQRIRAVHLLAYRYIPLIHATYSADATWRDDTRDRLVARFQLALATRYQELAEASPYYADVVAELEPASDSETGTPDDDDETVATA